MARKKKEPRKVTYIGLVIDRSGSMNSIREQAIAAINEQLRTIRDGSKDIGEVYVTLVQFDDQIQVDFSNRDVKSLLNEEYTVNNFVPRGMTALYDGVYNTIVRLEESAKDLSEQDDAAFLVVVISDGAENASKEITSDALSEKIKSLQDTNKWTFTYMLSNVDLTQVKEALRAYSGNMSSFKSNAIGTLHASAQMSDASMNYMTMRGSSTGSYSTAAFYSSPNTGDTK